MEGEILTLPRTVLGSSVTINPVAVTDGKNHLFFILHEILNTNVTVLVSFYWFIRQRSGFCLYGNFLNLWLKWLIHDI